jgi:hypothetical protein
MVENRCSLKSSQIFPLIQTGYFDIKKIKIPKALQIQPALPGVHTHQTMKKTAGDSIFTTCARSHQAGRQGRLGIRLVAWCGHIGWM